MFILYRIKAKQLGHNIYKIERNYDFVKDLNYILKSTKYDIKKQLYVAVTSNNIMRVSQIL